MQKVPMKAADFGLLKRIQLFAGLSVRELEIVAGRGTVRNLRRDTVFIECGDTSSSLYLILSGSVKVYGPDDDGAQPSRIEVRWPPGGS